MTKNGGGGIMARRTDRRVQRTRKSLRESLLALILEEGYDAIAIQDITDKANLGRATFYLHFKDKDELLLDVMDELMTDFFDQVPQLSEAHWDMEDTKAIEKLFDFAAEHYDLYRILIFGIGGITAARQLHRSVASNIKTCIQKQIEEKSIEPVVPPDFIANHFAGSLLSTIYWWLDNDLPYEVEEIASMFQKFNQLDRDTLMGFNHSGHDQGDEDNKDKRKKRGKDKVKQKDDHQLADAAAPDQDGDEVGVTVDKVKE
jgi:AcrR family transcriptional regulator